ncbi:hypothetical protein ACJZ2D_003875 [Fusarium nematophilum]
MNDSTGTGVAFSRKGQDQVKYLGWGTEIELKKLPTRLIYDACSNSAEPLGWGNDDPPADAARRIRVEQWFKTDFRREDAKHERVQGLYKDYLCCLYKELSVRFTPDVLGDKKWETAEIHFLFSAPATWSPEIVDRFKAIASEAGFDKCRGHKIEVSLTEPQAVAAFQICDAESPENRPQDGQTLLIVDAGGGTGDFCLLRVKDDEHGHSRAIELQPVTARSKLLAGSLIGSAHIDSRFEHLVIPYLKPIERFQGSGLNDTAWEMRAGAAFQTAKHEFGPSHDAVYNIPIPNFQGAEGGKYERIHEGYFKLLGSELRGFFDSQVGLIKMHLEDFVVNQVKSDEETQVEYLVLSGGLGSSPYVKRRVEEFCTSGQHPVLKTTKVVLSDQPQLAVCMGLVRHAKRSPTLFPKYCCRASFGIACRAPCSGLAEEKWKKFLDQAKTEGRPLVKDQFNKKWIDNCVDWFVRKLTRYPTQGDTVFDSGVITYPHFCLFDPKLPAYKRVCEVKILTSFEANPPLFANQGGYEAQIHVSMRVDLSRVAEGDIDEKNESWFKKLLGKAHYVKVPFVIQAKIGPAAVGFQCFDKRGATYLSELVRLDREHGGEALLPVYQG